MQHKIQDQRSTTLTKVGVFFVLILFHTLSLATIAKSINVRSNLKKRVEQNNPTSFGKSFVINKTKATLRLEYNRCEYDYNTKTEKLSKLSCTPFVQNLDTQQSLELDLSKLMVTSEIIHVQKVYIYKISDSSGHYRYLIKDPQDYDAYWDYYKNFRQGVRKEATLCTLFYEQTKYIYSTRTSFLCV